jgi:hypothetical protein
MMRFLATAAFAAVVAVVLGCDTGKPKIEKIEAPPPNAINEAKAILTNYANGQPVTSEAESFDEIVQRVRAVDSAKADVLEATFKAIKANRNIAQARAKEALKKL